MIDKLSVDLELNKINVETLVKKMFLYFQTELTAGNEISIPKFGKFYVQKRPERKGRNPKTGEEINIPESLVVKFKSSKTLKSKINVE